MTILQMQLLLKFLNFDPGVLDGEWGANTRKALILFQDAYGIDADGIPGENTYQALREAVFNGMPEKAPIADVSSGTDTNVIASSDWPYPHFTRKEMACQCGGKYCDGYPAEISTTLMETLENIRNHFGKPVKISSGLRCTVHNRNVGGVEGSYHTRGKAADIAVQGVSGSQLLAYTSTLGLHYTYAITESYVHIDVY